jgi:multidrug resistance efflux pump
MSVGPSQYKDRIDSVNEKLSKALTEAIVAVKEVIEKKNRLYSVDVENLDFEALKELEIDYERVSEMASNALSMRAQAKFVSTLDKSLANVEKSRALSEKLNTASTPEEKETIVKDIEAALGSM